MISILLIWSDVAIFLMRIFFGAIFIIYGWPKIRSLKKNAKDFNKMGFKPGILWGTIVALIEFIGGLALIFGFLTQIFAFLLTVQMAVATGWKIKNKKPFKDFQFDVALVVIGLALITLGAGIYAIDNTFQFLSYLPL